MAETDHQDGEERARTPGESEGNAARRERSGPAGDDLPNAAEAADDDPGFLTPSNLLSLTRIPMAFVFLVSDDPRLLAVVVAAGAITDLADGFLARISGTESRLGVLLDPFCDKFFVVVGLISFLPGPALDWSGFVILILRDIFTVSSYATGVLAGKVVPFTSRLGGKLTTALQVFTLFALIFAPRWVPLLVIAVAATSLWAIIDYGNQAIRGLQRKERGAAA